MAQSLTKIYIHGIFHIKTTSPAIREEDLERVHSYIGELINITGCKNIWVGGTEDHVHMPCLLSKNETVAHLMEEIKRNSSRWVKSVDYHYRFFEWQNGYAAFSVSQSVTNTTLEYIKHQREHHAKITFEDEYRKMLQLYHVDYNEEYVFRD